MSKPPVVSVLMPVYNGERFLSEAIESILNQTFQEFEFIIVDDGSTDKSWQTLQRFASNELRILLLKNEYNIGVSGSLNKGLKIAQGEYIALMNADDISLPGRLAAQVSFLNKNKNIGLVGTFAQKIDGDGNRLEMMRYPVEHNKILWTLCLDTPFANPTVLLRKYILNSVAGYSEELVASEDRDLWQRLSSVTQFANLPKVYLLYRTHDHNISIRYKDIQAINSAKAGQRMMQTILRHEVPIKICLKIRLGRIDTVNDAINFAKLINRLYHAFVSKRNLSAQESRIIRHDAALRLFNLAWSWKSDNRMHEFFIDALQISPYSSFNELWRKIKYWIFHTFKKASL